MSTEYDGSFSNKRPMDLVWLIETARRFEKEYSETRMVGFGPSSARVQINYKGMSEIAPLSKWKWHTDDNLDMPHEASVSLNGVIFFSIMTDDQRAEIFRKEKEGKK